MSATAQSTVPAAREAMVRHAWEEARDLFREAEQTTTLSPPDLDPVEVATVGWQ